MTKAVKIGGTESAPIMEFYPENGGIMNQLNLKTPQGESLNVLFPISDDDDLRLNPTFKNIPLFPFPNRLDGGKYYFEDAGYTFPLNEKDKHNNLHGFGFEEAWTLEKN